MLTASIALLPTPLGLSEDFPMATKIQELREKAKKLLEQAKREEEKAFTDLGRDTIDFLNGKIDLETLKRKAAELGIMEGQS
jgi:hypothetical protein